MRGTHRFGRVFVALATAILLGQHVCAIPFHAFGVTVTSHEDDQAPGHATDAVHGASCDAAKASPTVVIAVAATSGKSIPEISSLPVQPSADDDVRAVAAWPPLFLLHAALLI